MFKCGKTTIIKRLLLALVCCYFYLLPSKADEIALSTESVSINDIVTTSPEFADFQRGTITHGICNGGTSHLNVSNVWGETDALQWGACSDTFAMSIAINEALAASGTGISLDKIHYKWKWINGCYNITKTDGTETWCAEDLNNRLDENFRPIGEYADQFDTLSIVVTLTDANGNIVETKNYDYDTWYHWAFENEHSSNEIMDDEAYWQVTEDHIELFDHLTGQGTIYTPNQLGDISFVANGQDKGHWDGYYGPVLKDGEMWFTYRNNPCDLNTLYSPTCEGYATAYATHLYNEACASNTLYDLGCSGYQSAYRNQQCSINPLYEQTCPGYEAAYLDQQCNLDTLYDVSCTGYEAAYLDQQCDLNDLYSVECPLYQIAYLEQQCDIDTQYDVSCMGYVDPVVEEIQIDDPVQEIITPSVTVNTDISNITPLIIPQIVLPEIEVVSEDVTTESLEIEIAAIEAELNEPIIKEDVEESTSSDGDSGDSGDSGGDKAETKESTKQKETEQSESEVDGKGEETSNDATETKDDGGKEKVTGKDTVTEDGDGKDKEVEVPTEKEKKDSRSKKIKALIAAKIEAITKDMDDADTIEEQMAVQAQLLALIAFVPDFDYSEIAVPDTYFYPPEPTVDHAFSRWFVNDPNFSVMEDSQYPSLRN